MPAEYYTWIANLHARDAIALVITLVTLALAIIVLVMQRLRPSGAGVTNYVSRFTLPPSRFTFPAILTLGAILRLLNLGTQSLWHDEALSALITQRSLTDLLDVARFSSHPPAFYMLLWGWAQLWPGVGLPSEGWLRLPSALFGLVNIGLVYLVALRLGRPRQEALTAALFMAALPFQLFYSQEARMYQMLLFGVLLAWWSYLVGRRWCVVLGGTLAIYSQSMALLWLVSLGAAALLFDRSRLRPLALSGLVIGLLAAPWAWWGLMGQVARVSHGWIPQVTPGGFFYLWHVLLWGEANSVPVTLTGMVVALGLFWAALHFAAANRLWSLLTLAVGPALLAAAVSLTVAPVFLPRPLITVTPALYILLAGALWSMRRLLRSQWTGLLALLLIVALWGYYTDPKLHKWPARDWAADIRAQYQPGDVIFYTAKLLPSWWYLYDLPSYFLADSETEPNSGFNLSNAASAALGMKLVVVDTRCLENSGCLGQGTKRVFVVYAHSPATTNAQKQAYQVLKQRPVIHKDFVNDGQILTGSVTLVEWR